MAASRKMSRSTSLSAPVATKQATQAVTSKFKTNNPKPPTSSTPTKSNNKKLSQTPDQKGKEIKHISELIAFVQKNVINPKNLPPEISPQRFFKVLHEVVQEKIAKSESVTTSGILGDCFEKLCMDFKHAQSSCHEVLTEWSLPLIILYFQAISGKQTQGVLYNATGFFSDLSTAKKERVIRILEKAIQAKDLDKLTQAGIMYASNFSIGSQKFKDAGFVISLGGGEYLFLTDLEFKTAGSKGGDAQSATGLVRYAGVEMTAIVNFTLNGKPVSTPISNMLFNPIDLVANGMSGGSSRVVIKAGKENNFTPKQRREILKTLAAKRRLKTQKQARGNISDPGAKTNYGDNITELANLVSDIIKVGVDADLSGMRKYIYKFVSTLK